MKYIFFLKGIVMKLKQQIHLLVKCLSAILPTCWWYNIDMVMWFCLQSYFCLSRNCVSQIWIAGTFPEEESTSNFLPILALLMCQTFQKASYFKLRKLTFYKKCLSYFLLVLYFCIVILQTLFLALCQSRFSGFFSMMNQVESIFRIILRDVFAK